MNVCNTDFEFHTGGVVVPLEVIQEITVVEGPTITMRSPTAVINAETGKPSFPMIKKTFPSTKEYTYNLDKLDEFSAHQHVAPDPDYVFTYGDFLTKIKEDIQQFKKNRNLFGKTNDIESTKKGCIFPGCSKQIPLNLKCTLINGITDDDGSPLLPKLLDLYSSANVSSTNATLGNNEHNNNSPHVDSSIIRTKKYILKLFGIRDEKPEKRPSLFVKGIDPFTLLVAEKDYADCLYVNVNTIPTFLRDMRNNTYVDLKTPHYSKGILDKYGLTMDNINNGLGGHPVQVCFKCGRICINHRHLDLAGAPDEKEIQAINKKIVDENLESHFIRKLNFKGFPSFSPLYKFLTYKTFLDKGDTRYQCGGREEMIARAWIIYTNVKSSEVGGLSLSFDPTSTNPDNVERIEVASLKADDNSNQTILKEYIFSKIYPGKTKANINPPEKKINNATNAEVNFNTLSPNEQEAITQKAIKNAANQLAAAEAVAAGECAANVANVENQVARGGVFGEVDFFTSEKPLNLEKISYKLSKIRGTGNFPAFNESDDTIEAEIRLILELGRVSRTASGGSKKKQRKTNKRKTNKRKTSRRRTK